MDGSHGQVQDYEGPLTNEGLRIVTPVVGMAFTRPSKDRMGHIGPSIAGREQWWSTTRLDAGSPTYPPSLLEAMGNITGTGAWALCPERLAHRPWLRSQFVNHIGCIRHRACGPFAAWTWSLDHTSLAHSLLFVTSHPIVIVSFMVIMTRRLDWVLISGAMVGFGVLPSHSSMHPQLVR